MEKIDETISDYFKDEKGIIAVLLFGSQAVNAARPFSDIDIAIVADHASIDVVKKNIDQYALNLSRVLRKDIHIVMLNFATESLSAQVLKKGRCLIVQNRREFSVFKMNMLTKIADFSYHKKQMQAGFIKHLMEA